MPQSVPVTLFNANSLSVQISVNNGPQFAIAGAGSYSGWVPQSPASGGPTWSNTSPASNVLAPGSNSLMVTPQGAMQPVTLTVALPASMRWSSLQLYLFFNSYADVSWAALNEGQYVTGSSQTGR
jgi:hypothetical protein